jgi:hypothetical protein
VLVPLRGVVASQQKREIEGLGKKRRALFSSGSYRQPFDVCDKIAVENYRPAPPFVGVQKASADRPIDRCLADAGRPGCLLRRARKLRSLVHHQWLPLLHEPARDIKAVTGAVQSRDGFCRSRILKNALRPTAWLFRQADRRKIHSLTEGPGALSEVTVHTHHTWLTARFGVKVPVNRALLDPIANMRAAAMCSRSDGHFLSRAPGPRAKDRTPHATNKQRAAPQPITRAKNRADFCPGFLLQQGRGY